MAGQYGTTRIYTSTTEGASKPTQQCPLCKVNVVPRGLMSTRYQGVTGEKDKVCPNCGYDMYRTWYPIN